MKASDDELSALKARIVRAVSASSLTYSQIARNRQVHPSQVSRICRGEFKTVSHNVVQVCTALGLEVTTVSTPASETDAAWSKIEASARRVWDNSVAGADKIARILETIGQLKAATADTAR